jgi:hypothetical protein
MQELSHFACEFSFYPEWRLIRGKSGSHCHKRKRKPKEIAQPVQSFSLNLDESYVPPHK